MRVTDDRGHLEKGEGPCALRDVLSSLWQHIFASVTLGHIEKVLPISHNHQRHEREVIGLVVLNGFKETGYVPSISNKYEDLLKFSGLGPHISWLHPPESGPWRWGQRAPSGFRWTAENMGNSAGTQV